jgi:hypothetical protein
MYRVLRMPLRARCSGENAEALARLPRPRAFSPAPVLTAAPDADSRSQASTVAAALGGQEPLPRPDGVLLRRNVLGCGRHLRLGRLCSVIAFLFAQALFFLLALLFELPLSFLKLKVGFGQRFTFVNGRSHCKRRGR